MAETVDNKRVDIFTDDGNHRVAYGQLLHKYAFHYPSFGVLFFLTWEAVWKVGNC
jgi:hypothetical protein